eukprot:SM000025S08420  [mRNA]  locus=s25:636056:639886:- [translate_table: standard]
MMGEPTLAADVELGEVRPAVGGGGGHSNGIAAPPAAAQNGKMERKPSGAAFDHAIYDLTVQDLTYKVTVPATKKQAASEKTLLAGVSARALHGRILAVVGPSGAGKSTFLDAVAGRIDPRSLQGSILVNGKEVDSGFKRQSGYVMQDDALFPMLSVRETLLFSARLRLPASMTAAEKRERVDMLIDELGLRGCADTKIGNEEVRGVSGGERRRVSIGVDLIHDPAVLFLDEPTSGLDSTSALNVVQNLHNIAEQRKRTVILTIHQPSFRILELIHSYLVLARGHSIYHGSLADLPGHFREYGRAVPEHVNVLEYALDLIEEQQDGPEGLQPLVDFHRGKDALKSLSLSSSSMGVLAERPEYASGFLGETAVLADRNFKNIFRTKELFGARIGLMVRAPHKPRILQQRNLDSGAAHSLRGRSQETAAVTAVARMQVATGLTMGSLFFDAKYSPKGVQQRESFFAFTLALLLFTSTEALPIFLQERQIFIRETSRGAYRTSSYVIANAVVFLPFLFMLALIFSCVSYFMVGLAYNAAAFFIFVLVLFLVLAVANSFVIFFGALVPNFITGNTIITALTAYFFLFSGFFIPRKSIPKYWIWLHYLSTFKYPLESLEHNEFHRLGDVCWGWNAQNQCTQTSGDVLRAVSAGKVHQWLNLLIMVLFFVAYRVFFYVALLYQSASVRK